MWKTKFGRCVYNEHHIQVWQNTHYRWLRFDSSALQTVIHRRDHSRPILYYTPALAAMAFANPGNSLILGLGGGSIAHYLKKALIDCQMLAVELDPNVIDVAKAWFYLNEIEGLDIVQNDALAFLENTNDQYQHILVDLYNSHHFPENCQQAGFFEACKKRLKKNGVLAVNLANAKEHFPIFSLIKEIFDNNTLVLPIENCSNLVVYAGNKAIFPTLSDSLNLSLKVMGLEWDSVWGYTAYTRRLKKVDR